MFRSLLFTRIVPIVKDIGLWGEKVQKAYADMGVLDMAGVDLGALMKADEDIAEGLDRERAAIDARKAQVDETIAAEPTRSGVAEDRDQRRRRCRSRRRLRGRGAAGASESTRAACAAPVSW